MLETKLVGVDADESPYGEDQDPEHVEAEHLRAAFDEQLGSRVLCHSTADHVPSSSGSSSASARARTNCPRRVQGELASSTRKTRDPRSDVDVLDPQALRDDPNDQEQCELQRRV